MMVRTALVAAFALFVVFVAPACAASLEGGLNAYRQTTRATGALLPRVSTAGLPPAARIALSPPVGGWG